MQQLKFYRWTEKDKHLIWQWANDSLTRSMAFTQDLISWESHEAWFSHKLNDLNCFAYLAYDGDNPVGQIRFDIVEKVAKIDYSVSPRYRGRGKGTLILEQGTKTFFQQAQHIDRAEGEVKKVNLASIKSFRRAGFEEGRPLPRGTELLFFRQRGKSIALEEYKGSKGNP